MKKNGILVYSILIGCLLLSINQAMSQNGTIKGRIYNETTNEPLEFANIGIIGTTIGTTSDLDGNFTITAVPPGFIRLSASYIGFETYTSPEVQIQGNQITEIDLPIQETANEIAAIVVRPNFNLKPIETPLSVLTVTTQDIEKIAGANRDISKVLQVLPGVGTMAVNRNDLVVRGGGPAENVFYLDDIEIPILNHFTTQGSTGGAVSIINPDFIREINFYAGAFPANRPNALSSVMILRQKDGSSDRVHYKLSVGASDASIFVDGPMGSIGNFMVSARQSYLQLLFAVLQLPFLPTYNDVQFRFKFIINPKNQIFVLGLATCDRMKLNTDLKDPSESQLYILNTLPVIFQWSYTFGVTYKHFADNHYDTWVLSRNFLENRNYKDINNDPSLFRKFDYNSKESETKIRYESTYPNLPFKIQYGVGLTLSRYKNDTYRLIYVNDGVDSLNYSSAYYLWSYLLFFQYSNRFFDDKLSLSVGINTVGNNYNNNMANPLNQLSPRISVSYRFNPQWSINANASRYAQRPAYTTLGYKNIEGEWINKTERLKYIKSYQGVLGAEYIPVNYLKFNIEGFFKYYKNYPLSLSDGLSIASKGADFGPIGDEAIISTGKGRSYGVELLAQIRDVQGFTANLSYTLFSCKFTDSAGVYIPSSWDSRHIVNFSAGCRFFKTWYAAIKWRFTGGVPYSPIDSLSYNRAAWEINQKAYIDYDRFNTLRFPPTHQLDIRVDKEFYFKKWMLNIYIDIQNLYYFQTEGEPLYTNRDKNGNIIIDPGGIDELQGLRRIDNRGGTILPTIGVIIKI